MYADLTTEDGVVSRFLQPLLKRGSINCSESRALYELVASLRFDGPIIEIGTLFGFSTRTIAMAKRREQKLISVDNFEWNPLGLSPDNQFLLASDFLHEASEHEDVNIVRRDKNRFFAEYEGPAPALVFLDADHSYEATLLDIRESRRIGAKTICGHDHSAKHPGVIRAVEENGGYSKLVDTFWILNLSPRESCRQEGRALNRLRGWADNIFRQNR